MPKARRKAGEVAGPSWEALPVEAVEARLGARAGGLSVEEAGKRLAHHGPNVLPRREAPPLVVVLGRQFQSPLIAILALAAVVSVAIGEWVDAAFIALVLAINALIGGIQEWRAERGAQALQQLLRVEASVERDGEVQVVDAADLVPGDVVWLESGQRVPADLRLRHTHALQVDESLLTGESEPVTKDAAWQPGEGVPVSERANMTHAGSMVVRGRASGFVVGTGMRTELGRIAADVYREDKAEAPLLVRMRRFARVVGIVVLAAASVLAAIGVIQGNPAREMLLFAIAAAVSAVPEGLPVALTVALAVATGRMAKRKVIVRRLAAVEGLGSCTLIATDKTGTLTMNALTVREVRTPGGETYEVTGEGFEPRGDVTSGGVPVDPDQDRELGALAEAVALCNEGALFHPHGDASAWAWKGDPTDVALLVFAAKLHLQRPVLLDAFPHVDEIAFEPERRFAATYHELPESPRGVVRVVVKGAIERVVPMCAADTERVAAWMEDAEHMARAGLRVLAVAEGEVLREEGAAPPEPKDLRFLGFVGMMDPPRPGVPEAIEAARAAGVQVVMVTGDHPTTALAIARMVHLPADPAAVCTGAELEALEGDARAARIRQTSVFARVAPQQKLQIVRAAQEDGNFVAVTGDGVNDAPALRAANIGVAMGAAGTDVAREAAEVVIADDAFPSIIAGIEEGRVAYRNVRNVVFLLVSTGAAELLLLLLALVTGSPLPLLPAQLLWLNLVTNGIQDVALGMEPGRGDELAMKPRHPMERIFDRSMIERVALTALVMGGGGFVVFQWLLAQGYDTPAARNLLLLLLVLFENVHVGNSRSESASAFALSPFRNPFLLWGVIAAQGIHILALHVPLMQRVLGTEPVSFLMWGTLLAIAVSITVVFEVYKVVRRRVPVPRRVWPEPVKT